MPHSPSSIRNIPLGVLGDSDSHAYQDRILLPAPGDRGGRLREQTLQWTELLARLRGDYLDQGPWGTWGTRGLVSRLHDLLGLPSRAPRKQDFLFNFAVSGVGCESLTEGTWRQTQRLLDVMRTSPSEWRRGVIVIRLGVNSLGTRRMQDDYARDGFTEGARQKVRACAEHFRRAVELIRSEHQDTSIVLVNNCDDNMLEAEFLIRGRGLPAIRAAFDAFEAELQHLSKAFPRITYLADRDLVRATFRGTVSSGGRPEYQPLPFGALGKISWSEGDEPSNAMLADGHYGTVMNALWANRLLETLEAQFGIQVPRLRAEEVNGLVLPRLY